MMQMLELKIFLLTTLFFVCELHWTLCIKVYERMDASHFDDNRRDIIAAANGPKTFPQLRHVGYAFDDADDVIHIIEPPQRFQELKRRRHKVQSMAPVVTANSMQNPVSRVPTTKVKDRPNAAAKVEKPAIDTRLWRRNNRKKPANATVIGNKRNGGSSSDGGFDLLTQETRVRTENHLPPAAKMPLEILASVRKTERLLQQQKQQQKYPHTKQRIKTLKTHTLIMEKGYERAHYKRGNEHRTGGTGSGLINAHGKPGTKPQRMRRDVIAQLKHVENATADALQLSPSSHSVRQTQLSANSNIEKGFKLLNRIATLLQDATKFLPDDIDEVGDVTNTITKRNNSVLHALQARFWEQGAPKKLIGEIEPTATTTAMLSPSKLNSGDRDVLKILESSLKKTETIVQEIRKKQSGHIAPATTCEDNENVASIAPFDGNTLQRQLQAKIDCMRLQLLATHHNNTMLPISTTLTAAKSTAATVTKTATSLPRGRKRYGERTSSKALPTVAATTPATSSTTISTTTNPIRQWQRVRKHRSSIQDATQLDEALLTAKKRTKTTTAQHNVSAAAAALLYDDVMTNIRNMLEAKTLPPNKAVEQRRDDGDAEAATTIEYVEASASLLPGISIDASKESGHLRDLSHYLNELQLIVARLPNAQTQLNTTEATAKTNAGNAVNSVHSSSSTSKSSSSSDNSIGAHLYSDWYLINAEGKISATPLDVKLQPTAVIFHRFPDIPNAAVHMRNLHSPVLVAGAQQADSFELF